MKILLTGHKGWIGEKLYYHLAAGGLHQIVGFDFKGLPMEWHYHYSKIKDSLYEPPDLIIHCGAISDSQEAGHLVYHCNYVATKHLADDAARWGSKFMFFSSAAAIDPLNDYGRYKRVAEDYISAKLPPDQFCILRFFNVWGPDEGDKINPSIVWKILNNKLEVVYEPCVRDFVHIDDVVRYTRKMIDNWCPGLWEFGTGNPVEIGKLVEHCYHYTRTAIQIPRSQRTPFAVAKRLVSEHGRQMQGIILKSVWELIDTAMDELGYNNNSPMPDGANSAGGGKIGEASQGKPCDESDESGTSDCEGNPDMDCEPRTSG